MTDYSAPNPPSFLFDHVRPNQAPVKTEDSSSPDLSSASPSIHQFQHSVSSHASSSSSAHPPSLPHSIYRFGSNNSSPYTFVSSWSNSSPSTTGLSFPQTMSDQSNGPSRYDIGSSHQPFPYSDDYDDIDLVDVSLSNRSPSSLAGLSGAALSAAEKTVRRRSSKACDQCRKSKCKCERTTPGEPCKSCIMLGVSCTFLGPSRKRGPPKGYIDAIEARLHQTEALLGIIISSNDDRAQTLLRDLAKDPLAREIINRVDNSPYGVKGRKRDNTSSNAGPKTRFSHTTASSNPDGDTDDGAEGPKLDLASTHPSNEWQDEVGTMLSSLTVGKPNATGSTSPSNPQTARAVGQRPTLRLDLQGPRLRSQDEGRSPRQRQRRRLEGDVEYRYSLDVSHQSTTPLSSASPRRPESQSGYSLSSARSSKNLNQKHPASGETTPDDNDNENDNELTGAVGQLSLNEDDQVRYHGKSSGLHLLSDKVKVETRNEGGIWRFPKARVWPPLPSGAHTPFPEVEHDVQMPDLAVQRRLLDLYFTHVHPCFPVIHKETFGHAFKHRESSGSDATPGTSVGGGDTRYHSPLARRQASISPLLLFAMFALAARYEDVDGVHSGIVPAPPSDPSTMWAAGDEYLDAAKRILDGNYATSRSSTCQALLLLGFREIGIGAMAQSWTYIGMAIRMAQDLGMHRCADKWAWADLGGSLFGEPELKERKRIWWGCVIMDKYVSTYIGRPLMIFEQDFDTLMPDDNDPEEWSTRELRSPSPGATSVLPVQGRIISCFSASASLSNILGKIVEDIYAVRPQVSRQAVLPKLERLLDTWYLDLPEHLRFDPSSPASPRQKTVLPHVLTLHMQYWCAVLLLHRVFIRPLGTPKQKNAEDQEESRISVDKSHELCANAANRITTIASQYQERFPLKRAPVFLCYYLFSACIMHALRLSMLPDDPQARVGLVKSMEVLEAMQVVWPSAARALELMNAAKASLKEGKFQLPLNRKYPERAKRSAAHMEDSYHPPVHPGTATDYMAVRQPSQPQQQRIQHRPDLPMSYVSDPGVYGPSELAVHPSLHHQRTAPPATPTPMMGGEAASQSMMSTYPMFERWMPPDTPNNTPPSGPLSTSVLPQMYSTGLEDNRTGPEGHRMYPYAGGDGGTVPHGHRQPQYWNDYSAYSQLGATYGDLESQQQQQQQQPMPHSVPQQQMYMSGQYNLYS